MTKNYDTEHDYQRRKEAGLSGWGSAHFENRMAVATALALMDGHIPNSMIDLGAGGGEDAIAFYRIGVRKITAVEFSQTAVEMARKNIQDTQCDIHIIHDDVIHMNTANISPVEFVYSNAVLHFFSSQEDRSNYYSTIKKILLPKGFAFISTLCGLPDEETIARFEIDRITGVAKSGKRIFLSFEALCNELKENGFHMEKYCLHEWHSADEVQKEVSLLLTVI